MKYFFILKDEFIIQEWNHPSFGLQLILIKDEETLKKSIQSNDIKKYRKVNAFRNGSIVRLRYGLIWNDEMRRLYEGRAVKLERLYTVGGTHRKENQISFKDDRDWSFFADSIDEVLEY